MTIRGIFKSDINRLKRASPAKAGKRFASFFIDFVIVIGMAFLVFLAARPIIENSDSYKKASDTVRTEIDYYNDLVADTHIVEFIDEEKKERKDYDIMVLENINRAVYQSYLAFGNEQETRFVIEEGSTAASFGRADLTTDNVAYFYTQYVPSNGQIIDYGGRSALEYLYYLYESSFYTNRTMFTFDEKLGIPTMNTRTAYSIYHYLYVNEDDTDGQQGKAYYDVYYNAYSSMLERAESLLIRSEPYHTEHYEVYRQSLYLQGRLMNVGLIISILIGYLIAILLPKLLFKDEKTIGRLILGLGTIHHKDEFVTTPIILTLVKSIPGIIGFLTCAVVLYMFPPFVGVFDSMVYPLITIGSFSVSFLIIILIISIVAVINSCFSLFTHLKQCLLEMVTKTYLVDIHYLDDTDLDDQYEGKAI